MTNRKQLYAVRLHDRDTDNDPQLATLMYAWEAEGPWHDMATGHPDNIWELFGMTWLRDELHRLRVLCETHGIDWEYAGDDIEWVYIGDDIEDDSDG